MDYFRPTQRLFATDDALHVYDGHRLVSIAGSPQARVLVESVAACLDGRRGVDDVAAATGLPTDQVRDVIAGLRGSGLTTEDHSAHVDPARQITAELMASFRPVDGALGQALISAGQRNVAVLGADCLAVSRLLIDSGIDAQPIAMADLGTLDAISTLVVALPGPEETSQDLVQVNATALARGFSWLPVGGFDGWVTAIGPLIVPGETACLQCLLARRGANTQFSTLAEQIFLTVRGVPQPAAVQAWARAITAQVAMRWATNTDHDVVGRLYLLGAVDLSIRSARVFRVPRCTACRSDDWVPAAAPWEVG